MAIPSCSSQSSESLGLLHRSIDRPNQLNLFSSNHHPQQVHANHHLTMPSSATTTRRRVAGGRFFLLPLALLLLAMGGAHAGLLWGGGESDAAATTPSALALGAQVEPVHLDWEGIDCVLTTKDGRRKHLLKGVSRRGRKFNSKFTWLNSAWELCKRAGRWDRLVGSMNRFGVRCVVRLRHGVFGVGRLSGVGSRPPMIPNAGWTSIDPSIHVPSQFDRDLHP